MSDNNGWPDPARPGVPPNEGWWWILLPLDVEVIRYFNGEIWRIGGQPADPKDFAKYTLIGPVLTPAEVDARVKEARRNALEEAALAAENEPEPEGDPPPELHGRSVKNIAIASVRATKRSIAAAIRALKGEGDD